MMIIKSLTQDITNLLLAGTKQSGPTVIVSSVDKSVVDYSGGSSVVITGSKFTGASTVKFGSTNAASFTIDSDTQITAVTPAMTASATPVSVSVGSATLASAIEFFAPTNISNCIQWLRADLGITLDVSNKVSTWSDQSGNSFDMTDALISKPPAQPTTWINSKVAIPWNTTLAQRLDGTAPTALTSASAAEGFVIGQDSAYSVTNGSGLWNYGSGTVGWFPYVDGLVYENFCNSGRPNGTGGGVFGSPWLYNIQSNGSTSLFGTINQTTVVNYSGAGLGFGIASPCTLGNSTLAGFDGDIAEVMVFSRILTSGERARVVAYKQDRYDFAKPLTISDMALWLHASDLSNGAVSSWTNGSKHSFAQSTGANQPVKSSSPNRVTFTGSAPDYLTCSDSSFLPGAFSVSLLFKLNSLPGSGTFQVLVDILANNQGAGAEFQLAAMNIGGYQNLSFLVGSTAVGINPTLDMAEHTLTITYDGVTSGASPGAYTCYLDGVSQTINASSAFGGGGGNSIGTRFGGANSFDGEFGDIIIYNKVVSSTEATELHNYLLTA